MNVWFCIPSCRPAAEAQECVDRWQSRGYKVALLRQGERVSADLVIMTGEYLGWARSTNILCREVMRRDPKSQWCVGGGDDYCPSMDRTPAQIADDCFDHFAYGHAEKASIFGDGSDEEYRRATTFGVMQPTGDRWGDDAASRARYGEDRGAYIDRVAGSPWMGREWIERSYLGNGPMWDRYHHCFADEELQEVATLWGVFWQRPDIMQYHDHPGRKSFNMADWPPHLAPAITGANWDRDKAMFAARKAKGFPGSEGMTWK